MKLAFTQRQERPKCANNQSQLNDFFNPEHAESAGKRRNKTSKYLQAQNQQRLFYKSGFSSMLTFISTSHRILMCTENTPLSPSQTVDTH